MSNLVLGVPTLALLAVAAGLAVAGLWRWPPRRGVPVTLLRLAVLTLLALLVARPVLVSEHEVVDPARLLLLVDGSASMSLPAGPATTDTRALAAARVVAGLTARFGERMRVRTLVFDGAVRPLDGPLPPDPAGPVTDLALALRTVVTGQGTEQTRAAVLVSDGRSTRGGDPRVWARQASWPVHALVLGDPAQTWRNLAVESVHGPSTAFRDGEMTITARIRVDGPLPTTPRRIPVVLTEDGREIARQVVTLTGSTDVEFTHRPGTVGFVVYGVRLVPPDGDGTDRDDASAVAVGVEDQPRRLLLLSGAPAPELGFFRRAAAADLRFRVDARLAARTDGVVPVTPGDLDGAALVVLHRFDAASYAPDVVQALAERVRRGLSLIVIGVELPQARALLSSPLAPLLPFASAGPAGGAAVAVTLPDGALREPVVRVVGHPQANLYAWRNLPPVRPGAALGDTGAARTLVLFADGRTPAVLVRALGGGLVAVLNTADAWRWRLGAGMAADSVDVYSGFVSNLCGWAADRAAAEGLRLVTGRRSFLQGESAGVVLEDLQGRLDAGSVVLLRAAPASGEATVTPMVRGDEGWSCELPLGQAGPLTLTAVAKGDTLADTRILVVPRGDEFRDPRPDPAVLADVASISGGRLFTDPARAVAELDPDTRPFVTTVRSTLVWIDSAWVLGLLMVLLCGEWILRRALMRI